MRKAPNTHRSYTGSQTLLERTKNLFIRNYDGIPMEKITSTVGLNGEVDYSASKLREREIYMASLVTDYHEISFE